MVDFVVLLLGLSLCCTKTALFSAFLFRQLSLEPGYPCKKYWFLRDHHWVRWATSCFFWKIEPFLGRDKKIDDVDRWDGRRPDQERINQHILQVFLFCRLTFNQPTMASYQYTKFTSCVFWKIEPFFRKRQEVEEDDMDRWDGQTKGSITQSQFFIGLHFKLLGQLPVHKGRRRFLEHI